MHNEGFGQIRSMNLFFDCYYPTLDDQVFLFRKVKYTVRDFLEEKDAEVLKKIGRRFGTDKGIRVRKNEMVIMANKL